MLKESNENIIRILGIDSLAKEKQQEAVERLSAIVYQNVMLRVLDILDEKQKDEFEKEIEKNPDPENLFSWLADRIQNVDKIIEEEAQKLREESKDILGDL